MEYLPYMCFDKYVKDSELVRSSTNIGDRARGRRDLSNARYATRCAALLAIRTKLRGLLASRNQTLANVPSYADLFNSWRNNVSEIDESSASRTYGDDMGRRNWQMSRTIFVETSEGTLKISAIAYSPTLKIANEMVYKSILQDVMAPSVQMDSTPSKESVQGDATQSSAKDSNTIVTRDQSVTISEITQHDTASDLASSEPVMNFDMLVGRWMPVPKLTVDTTQDRDHVLATYYLPETFLTGAIKCAPNTIPFETFVYGSYDYEIKFVVNANKFQCGKVIASVKFDSYQTDSLQNGFQAHLSRPHVILDLSANNEGILKIPFRYHRAFVRNASAKASTGVRPGKFATVYVSVLSKLRTGAGGTNSMDIRPFYMLRRADFAGMSYKVPLAQMDSIDTLAHALPTRSLKAILMGVEKTLDQLGKSNNQDKPTDNRATIVIPRPRLHFCNGKGISDASVMRMNPTALTSYHIVKPYADDPKTTLDIARIWGLRSEFTWANGDKEGKELFNTVLDPCCRDYARDYVGQLTPVEYVCGMYQFWAGPIELRFDFVSNAFHTGSVIISAEFNRTSTSTDECESHSTYTKSFHLGDQKSVTFTVPYIYDTVWRRSTGMVFNGMPVGLATSDAIKSAALSIRPESRVRVKVRVLNGLRPVPSTTTTIDVLVFMRGGPAFSVHSLKQMDYREDYTQSSIDSFPADNYRPMVATPATGVVKRDTKNLTDGSIYVATVKDRILPKGTGNAWNEVLPKVQMDSGEKENEDSTQDFSPGKSALAIQSVDTQVGIKDILRRPTLLFLNRTYVAAHTGYFIPLMPPSRMMQSVVGAETDFSRTIATTPQAALMNLFRFWRGSMRYTILIHKKTSQPPIYCTFVPHSGTRLFSNKTINATPDTTFPIYGSGLATEIIIPQVNPTACVEAPYDTENNWTLTFDENAQRNYSWRDKGDTNSGHLVLSSTETFTFSVWWHAGDDFEFANFHGLPKVTSNAWAYQWGDESATTQMESETSGFRSNNVLTSVSTFYNTMKKVITPGMMARTAACAVPIVGTAYAAASIIGAAEGLRADIGGSLTRMENHSQDAINRVVEVLGVSLDSVTQLVCSTVNNLVQGLTSATSVATYCFDVILDILIAWIDKSWTAIGVSMVRFVGKLLGTLVLSNLVAIGVQIGEAISVVMQPRVAQVQMAKDPTVTLIGVLAGLVGTILGVKVNLFKYTSFMGGLISRLTEAGGMSYLINVLRFVEGTFQVIKDGVLGALGYVTPEAAALKMLSASSATLNSFVMDAQIITSEANSNMVLSPSYRQKFWRTVMQAYQIQKLLATVPSNAASPVLGKLCNDVIRTGNEKFVDISAAPVRYEPFVICIEGAAGIGKSELVEDLARSLLDKINFKRPYSGATYYRMPGSKFWSGYRDQPIVVYDDWLNITDPMAASQQLTELYQLKSTSLFIPEMAHLEEKKIRGNPIIVILLCNDAFPNSIVDNLVSTPNAVYRRRDVLLRAAKKDAFANVAPRNMSPEEQITFAHLEFAKFKNPTLSHSRSRIWHDYTTTQKYVQDRFIRWHAQEQVKVKRRMDATFCGVAGTSIEDLRLEDPFQLYYSVSATVAEDPAYSQNAVLPSELLAAEVMRIATMVQAFQAIQEEQVIPSEPEDPFHDGPVTQSAVGAIIAGVVTTKSLLRQALTWSTQQLDHWLANNFNQTFGTRQDCTVCYESCFAYAKCTNGTGDTPHVVCRDCHSHLVEHNRATTCPVCRGPDFKAMDVEDIARTMGVFALFSCKALKLGRNIGKYLLEKMHGTYGEIYTLIFQCTVILSGYLASDLEFDDASTLVTASKFTQLLVMTTTQMDDPFEEEEEGVPEEEEDEEITDFQCVLRDDLLHEAVLDCTEQPICAHRLLKGQEHQIEYLETGFKLYCDGGWIVVPQNPCKAIPCPFSDLDYLRSFYTKYLRERSPQLTGHLRGYYNSGTVDATGQAYHYNRIPPLVRPRWLTLSPELRKELQLVANPSWWEKMSLAYDNYKLLIWSLLGVSAAIGGLLTIHGLFKSASPDVQYISSGDSHTQHLRNTVRSLQRRAPARAHFQSVAGETPLLGDVVRQNVARNYVTIILSKGEKSRMLTACGLYNRVALLPRHYVKEIRKWVLEGAVITAGPALLPHEHKEYTFDEVDFTPSDVTDLATWRLPPSFGMFKDIRKYLCDDADLEKPITPLGELILAPSRRNPNLTTVRVDIKGMQSSEVVKDADGEKFTAYDVIVYNYSQPGACGNLLLLDRSTRPIVGMHFAGLGEGTSGEGFGVLLTKQTIGELANDYIKSAQMDDYIGEDFDKAKVLVQDSNVSYVGVVPDNLNVFLPRKTKIRPSLIQNRGNLRPYTEPCILDKTDPRYTHDTSPLIAGIRKHGQLTTDFKSSVVARAKERLWDGFLSKMSPAVLKPKRLTYEQAVSGFPDHEYYDSVVLSTSAGFPWCTTPKKRKEDYIQVERNAKQEITNVVIEESVLRVLMQKEELRRQAIVPITPFVDTLKDERRRTEKVLKLGGTRVFCNPPLDYVIAMRQNFLHFTAAFMKNRFKLQHAVGVNVNGTEWSQLARALISKSPNNVCTIDYANFGPGFNAGVAQAAMDLMVRWVMEHVEGANATELTAILEECLNSQHLCINTIYYQKCGSPSGAPITTVINTLVNQMLIMIAWELIMGEEIAANQCFLVEEYKKKVELFCYGDDLIMAVSDDIKDKFNAKTITELFSQYGIVATDATKGQIVTPYDLLTRATFLKMGFAKHEVFPHLWQSQLDWISINDTTQWIWECPDYKLATYENAKAALMSAHGHGRAKFDTFKTDVNRALVLAKCETVALTWDDIDSLFYPDCIY